MYGAKRGHTYNLRSPRPLASCFHSQVTPNSSQSFEPFPRSRRSRNLIICAAISTLLLFLPWSVPFLPSKRCSYVDSTLFRRASCKLCSLCLSFMWSILFATLFSTIQQPMSSPALMMLLLVAATPAALIVCGVLLPVLSFASTGSGATGSSKWPAALALIV